MVKKDQRLIVKGMQLHLTEEAEKKKADVGFHFSQTLPHVTWSHNKKRKR